MDTFLVKIMIPMVRRRRPIATKAAKLVIPFAELSTFNYDFFLYTTNECIVLPQGFISCDSNSLRHHGQLYIQRKATFSDFEIIANIYRKWKIFFLIDNENTTLSLIYVVSWWLIMIADWWLMIGDAEDDADADVDADTEQMKRIKLSIWAYEQHSWKKWFCERDPDFGKYFS